MSRRTLTLTVAAAQDGRRVRSVLQRELGLSAGLVTRLRAREGAVKLNGEPARTVDILRAGDILSVEVGDTRGGGRFAPSQGVLRVLWEDEDLLIIDKPADIAVHGRSDRGEPTVGNLVAAHLGADTPFHPVNRLDRGTTGVMCVAKNGYMHDRMRRLLHTDGFAREYLAITVGAPNPAAGRIELPITRVGEEKKFGVSPLGAPSATQYETVSTANGLALLRVLPLTGRTHQIRVHLAAVGCPLLGDRLYGSPSPEIDRPALHSYSARITHPLTGESIAVTAPLPEDMREVLAKYEIEGNIV